MACTIRLTKTLEIVIMDHSEFGYIIVHDKRGLRSIEKIQREYPKTRFIVLFDPPINKINQQLLRLVRSICSEDQV